MDLHQLQRRSTIGGHHHHEEHGHDHHDHDHHDHGHEHHEDSLASLEGLLEEPGGVGGGLGAGGGGDRGHGHSMSDLLLPLLVLGGFMLFFISERIVRSLAGGGGHSHSHAHGGSAGQAQDDDVSRRKKDDDFTNKNQLGKVEFSSSQDTPRLKTAGILNLVRAPNFYHFRLFIF